MKQLFGGIMLAVGILIAGACGLCSIAFLVSSASEPQMLPGMLLMIAMVGGIPLAVGVGLILGGRALIRRAREEEQTTGD